MAAAVEPPSYIDSPAAYTAVGFDVTALELESELPAYTSPVRAPVSRQTLIREPKEFTFEMPPNGKTSASLTLVADSLLSKNTAVISEGSSVKGTVNFKSEKGDEIHSVIITVKGELITGYLEGEHFTFLERSSTIWSQAMGDPRESVATMTKFTGKLKGKYCWPYCIDMPKEAIMVDMGVKSGPQPFFLPQTFLERHSRVTAQYEVSVRFCRGKLKSDQQIQARFGYIPKSYPSTPFSALRQLAYQENVPLMGPEIDPLGWHSLEPVHVRGKIFNDRVVDLRCTLSLAKPLAYTRNSVIPLYLKLESEDLQALDLLSSPKAVIVKLQRCVKLDKQLYTTVDRLTWCDDFEYFPPAVWWPSSQSEGLGETPTIRCLQGELHLNADLKPSSSMAFFGIEYYIHLLPFNPVAFEPVNPHQSHHAPLAAQCVQVVTMFSPGTRPRSYTPPGYDTGLAHSTDHEYRFANSGDAFF